MITEAYTVIQVYKIVEFLNEKGWFDKIKELYDSSDSEDKKQEKIQLFIDNNPEIKNIIKVTGDAIYSSANNVHVPIIKFSSSD